MRPCITNDKLNYQNSLKESRIIKSKFRAGLELLSVNLVVGRIVLISNLCPTTMSCDAESNINTRIAGVITRNISNDQQQRVLLFRADSECNEDALEKIQKTVIGKIISERDVIVVTKEDQLMDLISDAVEDADRHYINENAVEVISFVLKPESHVKHHATLVKKFPLSAAMDLASSSEFTYGNLWFLIPSDDINIDQCSNHVIDDVRKLSTFIMNELPILKSEAIALPAMYDGHGILWFKPNHDVYQKVINSSF